MSTTDTNIVRVEMPTRMISEVNPYGVLHQLGVLRDTIDLITSATTYGEAATARHQATALLMAFGHLGIFTREEWSPIADEIHARIMHRINTPD